MANKIIIAIAVMTVLLIGCSTDEQTTYDRLVEENPDLLGEPTATAATTKTEREKVIDIYVERFLDHVDERKRHAQRIRPGSFPIIDVIKLYSEMLDEGCEKSGILDFISDNRYRLELTRKETKQICASWEAEINRLLEGDVRLLQALKAKQ